MARPLRVSFPGAVYHVMSRGNDRQAILLDDRDCERYLEILEETVEIFGTVLYAYVLMGNHVHLLLKTPDANLSDFMRRLHLTYTSYFHRRHQRSGHLFQGRFKSHLVEEERYLAALSRYIHLNPVRVRGLRTKPVREKVDHLKSYRWSSLEGYRKSGKQQPFVSYDLLLEPYGGNTSGGRRAYWASLKQMIAEGKEKDYPGKLHGGFVLGSLDFARKILDRVKEKDAKDLREAGVLERYISEEMFWEKVKGVTGKSRKEVLEDRGNLRYVVMELLCRQVGLRGVDVARMFGLSEGAVSLYRKRARKRLTEDEKLRSLLGALEE